MKKKIIIATVIIALLLIVFRVWECVWVLTPDVLDEGDTGAWKPGYASPRQYYEEDGQILKSVTKTIDGINYTFDDLGAVMQEDNNGNWINNTKYQLTSGVELSNMWYDIAGELYYFDDKGETIKDCIIKVNGKQYSFDNRGVLRKYFFQQGGHTFGTGDDGAIIENGYFFSDGNYGDYYASDFRGYGKLINTTAMEFLGDPFVAWEGIHYYKNKPAYFFENEYVLVGKTEFGGWSEKPQKNGESLGMPEGSRIYIKENNAKQIFIYDQTDNSFYEYVLSE